MKISLPKRELIYLITLFVFLCVYGVGVFNQWNASRSGQDFVTLLFGGAFSSLVLLRMVPQLWKSMRDYPLAVPGETLNVNVELAPGDVLIVQPLLGIERKKVFVRVSARLEERIGEPYKSFQMSPPPIRHHIDSTCQVVLYETNRNGQVEVATKMIKITNVVGDESEREAMEDNELFVGTVHDHGEYALQLEPLLPEVLSRGGKKLKWDCNVSVGVLVEQLGIYDDVRLKAANTSIIPAGTSA